MVRSSAATLRSRKRGWWITDMMLIPSRSVMLADTDTISKDGLASKSTHGRSLGLSLSHPFKVSCDPRGGDSHASPVVFSMGATVDHTGCLLAVTTACLLCLAEFGSSFYSNQLLERHDPLSCGLKLPLCLQVYLTLNFYYRPWRYWL